MSTWVSNQFIVEEAGQNGASVTAWLASRFVGGLPVAQDTVLPTGDPDAGPVTTSVDFGGPGFWSLQIPTDDDYVIAVSFGGSLYYSLWTAPGGSGGGLPAWDMYGSGSPVGTVTPSQQGARYQDIDNGALYEAIGATSADWVTVGGNGDNTVPGVTVTEDGQVILIGALNEGTSLSDVGAIAGSGNQFGWVPGAADGDQTVAWQTGALGEPKVGGIDQDGNVTSAGWVNIEGNGSLHFADEDPNTAEAGVEGDVCWRNDTRAWYGCTVTGDPGTWTPISGGAQWGQVSTAKYSYAGDPSGHVTPDAEGDLCVDTATPALYQATGTGDTDWQLVAGGLPAWFQTGAGAPTAVVPNTVGGLYFDTTGVNGLYSAYGASEGDWLQLGFGAGATSGLTFSGDGSAFLIALGTALAVLSSGDESTFFMVQNGLATLSSSGEMVNLFVSAGTPNGTVEPTAVGDVCFDTTTPAIWQASGVSDTDWVQLGGGGGGNDQLIGQTAPIPASFLSGGDSGFFDRLSFTAPDEWPSGYDTSLPSFTDAGTVLTATADGRLMVDGDTANTDDVIVVYTGGTSSDGVYAVTDQGDVGTPWVLTRVAPFDVASVLAQQLIIGQINNGSQYAGAFITWDGRNFGDTFGSGSGAQCSVFYNADAGAGGPSRVEGYNNHSGGTNAHVEGDDNFANQLDAHVEGAGNQVGASYGHAEGQGSVVSGNSPAGHAEGVASYVYLMSGAHAESGQPIAAVGDSQFQRAVAGVQTDMTDTPTSLGSFSMKLDYLTTALVTIRIVARRIDVPGTDSAWIIQGVMRGDGAGNYTWVGGTDPVPVLVAQDVAAATWAVEADNGGGSGLVVLVTGDSGSQINWSATVEFDETFG